MNWHRVCPGLLFCFLLSSCATDLPQPSAETEVPPLKAEEGRVTGESDVISSQPLKHLLGRKHAIKPQPTRPLNVRSNCNARDAIGTRTRMELLVKEADVKTFRAEVNIAGRGACRFDIKDFQQSAKLPNVLLSRRSDPACTVRMWEQGSQVTVAFSNCATSCEGDAFSYLWPILVDARSGRCI